MVSIDASGEEIKKKTAGLPDEPAGAAAV